MMNRALAILAAATVCGFATIASAQTRPDFSGRWTSDADPAVSAAPAGPARGAAPGAAGQRGGRAGDMGSGWGSTITIAQDASKLSVEYAFFGRGDMQPPLKFVYALDGSETRNSVMMGRGIQQTASMTAWQADKLVITTIHGFTDPDSGKPSALEVKQVLSLESPASLVVETTRSGVMGGPPSTTRTVYRKL
jgi:arylsulfatase